MNPKIKVFCDMDGTIADLFSAVSLKLFNKQYKNITPEEKAEAKKIWYDREHFIDNFGDVEEFFANLPTFGNNGEITKAVIDTIVSKAGSYVTCSHPAGIDIEACKRGKITWIKKHLHPQPVEMLFPQNKAIYAKSTDGTINILVDDFPPYLQAWQNAGGVAIEMRADTFSTANDVKKYLDDKFNNIKVMESFKLFFEKSIHEPRHPGILKHQVKGKLTCSKARALKGKGGLTAKAAQRYLNYHCQ